jgi:hypothetical protein
MKGSEKENEDEKEGGKSDEEKGEAANRSGENVLK